MRIVKAVIVLNAPEIRLDFLRFLCDKLLVSKHSLLWRIDLVHNESE